MKRMIAAVVGLAPAVAAAATYEVPVHWDCGGVNVLPVDVTFSAASGGIDSIRYDLPAELTGEPRVHVVLTLAATDAGGMHFAEASPANSATCARVAGRMRCTTTYDRVVVNFGAAESFLAAKFAAGEGLTQRLAVASTFFHEAIGVLSFDAPDP